MKYCRRRGWVQKPARPDTVKFFFYFKSNHNRQKSKLQWMTEPNENNYSLIQTWKNTNMTDAPPLPPPTPAWLPLSLRHTSMNKNMNPLLELRKKRGRKTFPVRRPLLSRGRWLPRYPEPHQQRRPRLPCTPSSTHQLPFHPLFPTCHFAAVLTGKCTTTTHEYEVMTWTTQTHNRK